MLRDLATFGVLLLWGMAIAVRVLRPRWAPRGLYARRPARRNLVPAWHPEAPEQLSPSTDPSRPDRNRHVR